MKVKHLIYVILAILLLGVSACLMKLPTQGMPDSATVIYDSRLSLPIAATSISIKPQLEKLVKETGLEVASWDPLTIRISTSTDFDLNVGAVDFGDYQATFSFQTSASNVSFEAFNFNIPDVNMNVPGTKFDFSTLEPPSQIPAVNNIPVASGTISIDIPCGDSWDELTFSQGMLTVTLDYTGDPASSIRLEMLDASTTFSNVNDGDTENWSIPLANKTIGNTIPATVSASYSPETNSGIATLTFSFDNAYIKSAKGLDFEATNTGEINVSLNGVSNVASCTMDATVDLSIDLPDSWENVSLRKATVTLYEGLTEIASTTFSGDATGTLELHDYIWDPSKNLTMKYEIYATGTDANVDFTSSPTLNVNTKINIRRLSLTTPVEQRLGLPPGVVEADIKSGKVVLSTKDATFLYVKGYIRDAENHQQNLGTNNGNLECDLTGLSLPATLTITKLKMDLAGGILGSDVAMGVSMENLVFATLTIQNTELNIDQTIEMDIPADMVKSFTLKSGKLKIEYRNTMPLGINWKITSPQMNLDATGTFLANAATTVEVDLANKKVDLSTGKITITVAASPQGYDGKYLTFKDVAVGQIMGFSATTSLQDISIGEIVVSNLSTSMRILDSLNLEKIVDESPLASLVRAVDWRNMSGLKGWFGLDLGDPSYDVSIEARLIWEGGEATYTLTRDATLFDFTNMMRDILTTLPASLSVEATLNLNTATLTVDAIPRFSINVEIPASFTLNSTANILADSTSLDLTDIATYLEYLENVHIGMEGTNTTGIKLGVDLLAFDKPVIHNVFATDVTFGFDITIDIIDEMIRRKTLPVTYRIFLPKGTYVITGEGKIDIKLWSDIDFSILIPVGSEGGDGR